jgi:hypothetical protein
MLNSLCVCHVSLSNIDYSACLPRQDVTLSKDLDGEFKNHLRDKDVRIGVKEFNILVLTSGFWPYDSKNATQFGVPQEVRDGRYQVKKSAHVVLWGELRAFRLAALVVFWLASDSWPYTVDDRLLHQAVHTVLFFR